MSVNARKDGRCRGLALAVLLGLSVHAGLVAPKPDSSEAEASVPGTILTTVDLAFEHVEIVPDLRQPAVRHALGPGPLRGGHGGHRTAELDLTQQVKQAYVDLQVAQSSIGIYDDT